jgi:carboxyl-terminal processing protease
MNAHRSVLLPLIATIALTACGGGGGGGGGGGSGGGGFTPVGYTPGQFSPAANFASQCMAPRTGTDPATGRAYPDRAGTVLTESNWLRSWSNDLYLWYSEIPDQDPAGFATPLSYFNVLKTTATTASGAAKDKFHFTYDSAQWYALSQGGVSAGYGPVWEIIASRPPRDVRVAWVEPLATGTATEATLARGALVLTVDGIDVTSNNTTAGINALNAGLFPSVAGQQHTFVVQGPGALPQRTVTLTSANITSTPVMDVGTTTTPTGKIGYMLFNDHLATSEAGLRNAFTTLANAGVNDLVLDLRYNGGGYLDIASEVAYMVAGNAATAGKTFELTQFNAKHPSIDPVAGGTITPVGFHSMSLGFAPSLLASGQPLPTLNLARVFVLTGTGTCSASESIINGLRGIGVQVIQVGSTTCGKPYGFYPQDNCGTTYFSIEFRGVNAVNFGDYSDGFTPQNSLNTIAATARLPGCSVADDFNHELGDPLEGRFAAALNYRDFGSCPSPSGLAARQLVATRASVGGEIAAPPVKSIRLLRPAAR